MKDSNMTLSIRNDFLIENVTFLMGYLAALGCEELPKYDPETNVVYSKKNPKYDPEKYEKLADGIHTIHIMLLHSRSSFRTARGATRACLDMVINEMAHIDHVEKPGFEAARDLFERMLK